jgi:ELWxxDGT repeat protein
MLRDINPTRGSNGSLAVYEAVTAQNVLYFPGNRWDTGTELWRSDGTVFGTRLVRDLALGTPLGQVQLLCTNGTLVFFTGYQQVFRSDGTEAGTYAIGGYVQPESRPVTAGAGTVWAVRNTATQLTELWASDGTTPTPVLLLAATNIDDPVPSGARAYFAAQDLANGWELWHTDGTPAGTVRIDLVPGVGSANPTNLGSDGAGGVWFAATVSGLGAELWHSDGTSAGTQFVVELNPGIFGSDPQDFRALGSLTFFTAIGPAGRELWVTNGTAAGTQQVRDIAPGNASSTPMGMLAVPALGRVVFSATDPVAGREPWVSDGTAAGTLRLADINPGNADSDDGYSLRASWLGGKVWFAATSAALGRELYRTDGTPAGTALVADLVPGTVDSDPRPLGQVGGTVLFSIYQPGSGVELWKLVPPATVPTMLGDFHPGRPESSFASYPAPLVTHTAALDGRQHFAAFNPGFGTEPHAHDGTRTGTVLVGQVAPSSAGFSRLLAASSTHVYYEATDDSLGGNPRLVAVPRNGPPLTLRNGVVMGFAVLRDRLVFGQQGTDSEPMITDGTVAGTVRIADVRPGTASSLPTTFATMGERVFFFADDGVAGRELWVTDGTGAGTALAVDCVPGPASSGASFMVAGTTRLYFRSSGVLWSSNGTAAGTNQFPAVPFLGDSAMLGDVLIAACGNQLWRADGTAAGTFVLAQSDSPSSEPIRYTCAARGRVFCSVLRAATGPQLWATDGTVAGTGSVLSLHPQPQFTPPRVAAAGLGHVAVARATATTGTELWVTDGTPNGAVLVVDAQPGSAPSNPVFAAGDSTAGGRFTWWADTVWAGLEPWSVPLTNFGGSDFDLYGVGCPGMRGVPHIQGDGLPILGSSFAYQLRHAAPSAPTLLLLGLARTPASGPCQLLNNGEVLVLTTTDVLGQTEHAIAVPASTSLDGLEVHGQFLVLDSAGAFLGFAAVSAGLTALIGR